MHPAEILETIRGFGPAAVPAYIGIYMISTLFLFPNALLMISAGVLFGPYLGFAVVSVAAAMGSSMTFLLGRYLPRRWLFRKIENNRTFKAVEACINESGWKAVFLLRFSVLPFHPINYCFGLTKIPWKEFILATWVGMAPGIVLYTYLGSISADLANWDHFRQKTPLEWSFLAVGTVATLWLCIYFQRVVKRKMAEASPA